MDLKNKYQIDKNKTFLQALGHAFDGVKTMLINECNFRKHLIVSVIVLILGCFLQISINQLLWLVFACYLVLQAEIINTIIEYIVDLMVGHNYNLLAKKIKDIAAGGVLFTALVAVLIGCIIFIPKLLNL
ncbi:diacylglycerol kinase family protein [Fructilactobacillus vespulae]|uniref:diacylglycerol kinase family protein n=1 Tax=Fructilactobacillus vespulae TaxID=1249630 RepID=UPI0039B49BD1